MAVHIGEAHVRYEADSDDAPRSDGDKQDPQPLKLHDPSRLAAEGFDD